MTPRTRLRFGSRLGLLAGWMWLLGGVALAQQPAAAPLSPSRKLVFSVRLFQTLDQETRAATTALPALGRTDFARTAIRAEVERTFDGPRSSLDLAGASQFSHGQARGRWRADEEWAAARLQVRLSRLTSLTLSERAGYLQTYTPQAAATFQAVASNALIDVPDLALRGLSSFTTSSGAGLSRTLTRRSRVLVAYDFNRVAYAGGGVAIGNHRISAVWTRTLARNWSLQAGYHSAWGATTSARETTSAYGHEAGLRTELRLPFSHGTTVSAGLAPGVLGSRSAGRDLAGGIGAVNYDAFALQGQASVDHALGPASRLGFAYERTASFPPGSTRPILANVLTARGSAQWHRRVSAQFSLSSSRGASSTPASSVRSLSGWARAEVRMSAAALVYVEHARDSRTDARGMSWVPGLDRNYTYRSVRAGVNVDFGWPGLSRRWRGSGGKGPKDPD